MSKGELLDTRKLRDDYWNDFWQWVDTVNSTDAHIEVMVEDFLVSKVSVTVPKNREKENPLTNLRFGRYICSKNVSYIKVTMIPRIVNGKFKYNIEDGED